MSSARRRRNQSLIAVALSASLFTGGLPAVPVVESLLPVAHAAGEGGFRAKWTKDKPGVTIYGQNTTALTGNHIRLDVRGERDNVDFGELPDVNFPSGQYRILVDGEFFDTATGTARRAKVPGQATENAVLELSLDNKSLATSAGQVIRIESDLTPTTREPGESGRMVVTSVANIPLNTQNDPGGRDPLFGDENQDKCIQEVEGTLTTGTTTWIAESFDAATGERDANRNRTVLQYRQDGVNDGDHFQPVPGKDPDANLGPGESDWVYNSLAYNSKDGYLYAISQKRPNDDGSHPAGALLRISPQTGAARPLGLISGLNSEDVRTGFTNGAFDFDGDFIFSNNSQFGSGTVYRIPFKKDAESGLAVPTTPDGDKIKATEAFPLRLSRDTAEAYKFQNGPRDEAGNILKLHRPWNANDWAFEGLQQNKYIWSVSDDEPWADGAQLVTSGGALGKGTQRLWRTDTTTGVTDFWDINNLRTPAGDKMDPGIYGNAWTYGNGDLGFSNNDTGTAYRIAVNNSEGARDEVEIALVSKEQVPHSYNNDAATNAYTVSELEKAGVDLEVAKELKKVDGKWEWTIEVTNNSPCVSSGFAIRDLIGDNLDEVEVEAVSDGWISQTTAEDGTLNWVHGPLEGIDDEGNHKQTAILRVTAGRSTEECAVNRVSVIGNEEDPNPNNDSAADGDCDPQLKIKKYIGPFDESKSLADHDPLDAQDADTKWPTIESGQPVLIRYVVTNTGSGTISDISLSDVVDTSADKDRLQRDIDNELGNQEKFSLSPNDSKTVNIIVNAPAADSDDHRNEATANGVLDPRDGDFRRPPEGEFDPFDEKPVKIRSKKDEANALIRKEDTPPPVVENPQFSVEKLSNQSAINLERNQDGKYSYTAEYTIIVRNDGKGDGEHASIYDVPLRGVGFELNSVQVDGQDAQLQNGRYKIADGAALAAGESKTFTVTVSGTISDAAAGNLPAAYGQCNATGADATKNSGLLNVVNMDGDSDGPDNNIVCTPVELRRLNIEKRIDGREEAVVKPGEPMDIWYRVRNTGNVTLHDVKLSDNVQENNKALQQEITKQLNGEDTFDLEPGEIRDVHISVKAPEGEHVNEARADVPPTTIPPVTLPHTTVPGKPVPSTAVSTTAKAKSPKITIKKYVNGYDDGTAVAPGEDMEILYRVVNEGSMPVDGIRVVDKVTQATDKQGLQAAINAELAKEPAFKLEPGGVKEIRITVPAPAGGHVNEAVATAPVTVPGTTVPPITVPPITKPSTTIPGSTVPGTTVPSTVVTVTAPPDEGRSESPQLEIKKFINGRDEGDVLAVDAETMEITYRVTNTGASAVKGITIADEVTEGSEIPNLEQKLGEIEPFDLAPGEFKDITLTGVTAPKGGHVNVAKPVVPPVTVPATTIPGTTNPNTTIPPTTVPERTVSPTTTPSDDARSNVVKLELLKDIWSNDTNNWKTADKVDEAADAAVVDANGKMRIRYTVKNTGSLPVSGIGIVDEVTELTKGTDEDKQALTDAINAELEKYGKDFTLQPGKSRAVEITVDAPKQRHINVAKVTAPPVTTLPGSTIPGTTVMTTTNGSTVPVTTVTPRVVEPSTVTPNTPSNTAHATPTSSTTTPVVPEPVKPQFAVEKLGNQSGITLERNKDGKYGYSAEYTIRVRNTGSIAGEHAKVWDVPVRGVGFDIDSVTVDGTEVKPDSSRYLISKEAELAVGEYKDFQVVVNGTVTDQAANALPTAVGQCDAVTADNPGAGDGLVNVVTMEGDSDGRNNNIVCEPVELRRLNIEKRIDGRENAPVTPGDEMEIWYRVRNTGNVTLSGITLADQIKEDNEELQKEIDAAIAKIEAFDLAPGEVKDITFPVTAYEGEHTNEVRAQVPETTVPGTTRPETSIPETTVPPVTVPGTTNSETTVPGTTIPGSTVPATTIPGTTVPGRSVPPTTVTATAHAGSPSLAIKKYINGYDDGTQVAPGEDMEILYRVSNTGSVRIDGIRLADEVTEAADENTSKALQRDIDAKLNGIDQFALEPGEVREFRITVPAPAGGHVNVAKPIVPPVTVPGTTIPGTTNPNTTIPASTVPSTVVTVTTPSDDARSDSPLLDIKKYINNLDDGDIVEPGQDMVITYRVFNNGNADAKGVTIADEVTEGSKATKADLTKQIEAELAKVEPIDIPAGEFRDVEITVKAPAGGHVNVAKPNVPPVTVPATTIPGTTNPRTTIPETTVPERVVTQTTTPSDDARSDSLKLEILKDIFSLEDNEWHAADTEDDAAVVDANGKMRVRYTVTNTGSVTLSGIDIIDNVTRLDEGDQQALTDALNGALEAEGRGFTLKPGEKKIVEITVDAPKGYHVNEAIATAPAVPTTQTQVSSVPGTTDATTTVPGSLTTTVVTTEKTPNVPTNTAQATPTTSATTPVPPPVTTTVAPEQPQFAVEKLGARAGNVALTRNEEGSYDYSNEYVIRVRNSGLVDGEHATIWDVPLRGAGFTVNEVTVDDKAVEVENGRYKVADAAALKPGKYKDYKITVTGTLAEAAANNLPEAVGQCTAEGANPGADSGLVNVANMNGDSDGPGNNVVCTPVELRRLNIEKRINGREDASVTPGEKMEIWYRVRNTGNVELTDIALADQIREDNPELQEEINAELAKKAEPFNLAPGAFQDIRIEVTAPKGEHVNEARAEVPETTVPGTTRPGTTIPGTTGPSTTVPPVIIPGTTLPGRPVPGTTVSTTARANSPLLEVKKFINGRDEHALVNAGEDMDITYRVTNKGTLPIDGIRLTDEVKEDNAELQQAIDAQLGKVAPFALEPGESMDVTVTVKAPAGRHDNVAGVTVPPVTIPATTIPGTTNPHTTVPGTTVPSTVVTVTAPPDDASSDSPQLEILKEIKRADEGDDAWRDAETEGDALPIGEGETMELRYTVTNTGSVKLDGVDIVDNVTRLDGGDADEFTAEINKALESAGRGLSLEPGESVEIVIEVSAPAGYHVNEAIATAPPVTATETVVSSVPGTTNETTTVPGSFVTETTVVERTPNTPTNKAQSTPTTGVAPCDCEVKTTTIIPAPVTTTVSGEVTTVTPDPVTSEVTITETPEPVTSEVTTTETPEPIVTTVVQTQDPITVTRTTPVTTVQTVTPEPQTVVTTVEGPEVTTTPDVPGQVVVVVDDSGKTVTEVAPTPVDGYTPPVTATATYTLPPVVTETLPQITVTEVPTTLVTTKASVDEGNDILGRCIANAVRSPILYMVPLLLAGQVLGEVAAPYVKAVNDQFNQISAEIQDEIRRKTPNFGHGRRGQENEQVAELRAKAEAANRMLQELAMRPDVQQYGQWAAIAAGVVVAGSVLYDWCSNEAGEAFTAIGPKKSTSVDEVRVGGSSLGGDRVTTVVPPVTNTPGRDETGEDAGEAGSEGGSSEGSSAGSSEGSSN